jgi:hypothetical protein
MSNALATQQLDLQPREDTGASLMQVIAAAAANPQVDVSKMQALLEMKMRLDQIAAEQAFNLAMKAAQDEMVPIVRNCQNSQTGSKYASLEQIDYEIRPIYTKHGFSLSFNSPDVAAGELRLSCDVRHIGGYTKAYFLQGALDLTGPKGTQNKTSIMALGSSVTYLQRYLTRMIFNLIIKGEDKDGVIMTGFITEDQTNKLLDLLIACGSDKNPDIESGFLKFMEAKVIGEIQKRDYEKAHTALSAKLRQVQGGKK